MLYVLETRYNSLIPYNPQIVVDYQKKTDNYLGMAILKISKFQSVKAGGWYSKEFTPQEIAEDLRKKLLDEIKANNFLGFSFVVLKEI